ncbi:MAG TPA: enolase C-terminal domain-like protein [Lamprocystis sp. (in: g-proteobacteria)]|nr:enolase C-terminal domain-like protein [Lamprocystis sp. (in: g-proteobacteria)]
MNTIERLDLTPYVLPLTRVWTSSRGNFRGRQGWLVTVACGGVRGYGDCAPQPEAGTETHDAAAQRLLEHRARCPGQTLAEALDAVVRGGRGTTPAADFALDCALQDVQSRLAGTTLRAWLDSGATDRVPVNGALGPLIEATRADLDHAARTGLRVLKLKVGIGTPEHELQRLSELAATLPVGIALRLDANGAWDPGTATQVLIALRALPVESVEEPLRDPDWTVLARLQSMTPFPLALDESLPPLGDSLDPDRFPVRRAVLKPAAIGGLRRTLTLARRLQAAGIEVVITGLVESAAGLWPTAQLAAAIGSRIPQGLATADWLAQDLGVPPRHIGGHLQLPSADGSGFTPYGPTAETATTKPSNGSRSS